MEAQYETVGESQTHMSPSPLRMNERLTDSRLDLRPLHATDMSDDVIDEVVTPLGC